MAKRKSTTYMTYGDSAPGRGPSVYGGTDSHAPRTCPNLPAWAGFGHESAFSFDRERPFSFRRNRKENGGSFPRRKAAQSPVPAPWAGHPVPARRRTLSASLKEKQGPCPCAAQRHIVPRLTARRPWRPLSAWDTHLLHF